MLFAWEKFVFYLKFGVNNYFYFSHPKRHHLAPDRFFWFIPPKIPLNGLGCTPIEEPSPQKKEKNAI